MDTKTAQVERVNEALNRVRQRLGFVNDLDLARHLGVSPKTVSFWRNGRWYRNDQALIAVLTEPERVTAKGDLVIA